MIKPSLWVVAGLGFSPEGASLALGLWVIYTAVFVMILVRFDLLEPEPLPMLSAAFLWGALVATSAAAQANTALLKMLSWAASADFTLRWGAAVVAPPTEETLKVLGVVVLVLIA